MKWSVGFHRFTTDSLVESPEVPGQGTRNWWRSNTTWPASDVRWISDKSIPSDVIFDRPSHHLIIICFVQNPRCRQTSEIAHRIWGLMTLTLIIMRSQEWFTHIYHYVHINISRLSCVTYISAEVQQILNSKAERIWRILFLFMLSLIFLKWRQ